MVFFCLQAVFIFTHITYCVVTTLTSVRYLFPEPQSLQLLLIGVLEQLELLYLGGQISLLSS